jgi:hypothetical protein
VVVEADGLFTAALYLRDFGNCGGPTSDIYSSLSFQTASRYDTSEHSGSPEKVYLASDIGGLDR